MFRLVGEVGAGVVAGRDTRLVAHVLFPRQLEGGEGQERMAIGYCKEAGGSVGCAYEACKLGGR